MLILSFARTTAALVARRKRVTRREWKEAYHDRFLKKLNEALERGEPGLRVQAWSASPHRKGKKVGIVLVTSITREPTCEIPDGDWEDEGFAYMAEHGLDLGPEFSVTKCWRLWRQDRDLVTSVIRFEPESFEQGIAPEMFFPGFGEVEKKR